MDYYNQIANSYDELHKEEQLEKIKIIKKHIRTKGILLDLGAGTGIVSKSFKKECVCIALDPSKELLKQYNGFRIIGKAEKIPFPNNFFDIIISLTALHHTNIKKALKEIYRVAKPSAIIVITILKKSRVNLNNFKDFKKLNSEKDWIFIKK